ncbi:MAG TPA: hypothetical protein VK463_08445 [Desulfomonilaceae bacterium]|nr:hypothetical protein [Desulfomonilaceae bacterium]
MLRIKSQDIRRATLPLHAGNEGWIGVSPRADEYHVVVPVDVQIARGVMACNRPTDGTPFGGYSDWIYFRCPPYEDDCNGHAREDRIRLTGEEVIRNLAAYGIEAVIEAESFEEVEAEGQTDSSSRVRPSGTARVPRREYRGHISCPQCSGRWHTLSEFIRDPAVLLDRYRPCLDDFRSGKYVFAHSCGGHVEIGVSLFARPSMRGKSLIGTHACPGMCYYETSFRSCSAVCEGSCYRRIALKLKSRSRGGTV